MSRALRSYKGEEQEAAVKRRLKAKTRGLGYLAAKAAQRKRRAEQSNPSTGALPQAPDFERSRDEAV